MTVIITLLIIAALIVILILCYAYNNLHKDERQMKKVRKAGFVEKQVTLPNGVTLNYGEGGNIRATSLFLIHGQGQAWQDYDYVLPMLAKGYHVYAVDCHGHGKSSHNVDRYTCKKMTEDFSWFLQNVVKKPCIISGHSSGGILAASLASSCRKQVSALIIEDAPFFCVEPKEMQDRNAIVWTDSFKLMHEFNKQKEIDSFAEYYCMNSLLMSLFGKLKLKMAASVKQFESVHKGEQLKLWYVPQALLRGMYYGNDYDMRFAETFYDGSWFNEITQKEILQGIACPTLYIKARTGYLFNNKLTYELTGENTSEAFLCCANTNEDADKVMSLIKNCHKIITKTNDHLIHMKYPKLFVQEIEKLH